MIRKLTSSHVNDFRCSSTLIRKGIFYTKISGIRQKFYWIDELSSDSLIDTCTQLFINRAYLLIICMILICRSYVPIDVFVIYSSTVTQLNENIKKCARIKYEKYYIHCARYQTLKHNVRVTELNLLASY